MIDIILSYYLLLLRNMQSNEIAKAESEVKVWLANHKPQVLSEAEIP